MTVLRRPLLRKSLDIRASVGTSTSPTATGTKAVTGVGFTPKVVLPFGIGASPAGAYTQAVNHFGAATASSQAAIAVASVNGVTTSATHRRHTATRVMTSTYNGTTDVEAALASMDSDGFTYNYNLVIGAATILNHICLGGADLEVSLTQQQMNGTNLAQSFAHGLSEAPTGVLFFGGVQPTLPPSTTTELNMSIGAWAGSSQWSAYVHSFNGSTTTQTRRILMTDGVVSITTTTIFRKMAVSSVDATNVNVTYPVTGVTQQHYFWMLAFRGARCQVGTFDCNGSLSPLTINTPGITPKLFLPVSINSGVTSVGSVLNNLNFAIGASDGTNNVSCGIVDVNGVTTTNARRYQDSTKLAEYDNNGTKVFEATAAFSGESVVVTPTIAGASRGQGGYLVIGS